MWVYGSGFPKSHNLKGEWYGFGTALKPAWEPIIMARKPLDGTVAENVQKWGTGAMDIDGARVEGVPPSVPQPKFNSPTGEIYGFKTGEGRNGQMSKSSGRWPANLIHDGSDEVMELFPQTKAGVAVRHRSGGNTFGGDNPKPPMDDMAYGDSGSAARFFYCAKASRKEREAGCEGMEEKKSGTYGEFEGDGRGRQSEHRPSRNPHPTVKPLALMEYLVRLVSRPGQIILDPFMGSGTTGMACKKLGREFIGIEKETDYIEIAENRIAKSNVDKPLFNVLY
jgi:site-specific DNA-methyltransferase (adenine-specific)